MFSMSEITGITIMVIRIIKLWNIRYGLELRKCLVQSLIKKKKY